MSDAANFQNALIGEPFSPDALLEELNRATGLDLQQRRYEMVRRMMPDSLLEEVLIDFASLCTRSFANPYGKGYEMIPPHWAIIHPVVIAEDLMQLQRITLKVEVDGFADKRVQAISAYVVGAQMRALEISPVASILAVESWMQTTDLSSMEEGERQQHLEQMQSRGVDTSQASEVVFLAAMTADQRSRLASIKITTEEDATKRLEAPALMPGFETFRHSMMERFWGAVGHPEDAHQRIAELAAELETEGINLEL